MRTRLKRLTIWSCLAGGCLLQSCAVTDPDLLLRAQLTFASDLSIFLLDNLVRSL